MWSRRFVWARTEWESVSSSTPAEQLGIVELMSSHRNPGRPFMYALTYGTEGVVHGIESKWRFLVKFYVFFLIDGIMSVLRDEIETTMRLLGVTKLSQLGPHLVSKPIPLAAKKAGSFVGLATAQYQSLGLEDR